MENNWIEWKWTPEKPFPNVDGDVYIRHDDGWESKNCCGVMGWLWEQSCSGEGITHYRIAED